MSTSILTLATVKNNMTITEAQCCAKDGVISFANPHEMESKKRWFDNLQLGTFLLGVITVICMLASNPWGILSGVLLFIFGICTAFQYDENHTFINSLYKIFDATDTSSATLKQLCEQHPAVDEYRRTVTASRVLRAFDIETMRWIASNAEFYEQDAGASTNPSLRKYAPDLR